MSSSPFHRLLAIIVVIALVIIVGFLFLALLPVVLLFVAIVFAWQFFKPRGYMRDQTAHQQYKENNPPIQKKETATDAVFTKKN